MDTLLSCCLHDPAQESLIYIPRFTLRLALTKAWAIAPGQRLLDIGCGQGESALVLALAVGPTGHITGIDDAPPEYGSPFAVGESQRHIAGSTLGPRITFLRTDGRSLPQSSAPYDAAVLCHSLCYFPSRSSVAALFHALATARIPLLYLAEYSLQSSSSSSSDARQRPHMLAAQALALLATCRRARDPSGGDDDIRYNVRVLLDEAFILHAARDAGFTVLHRRQGTVAPEEDFLEGHFEARYVAGERFRTHVQSCKLPGEQEAEVLALAARVKGEMEELDRQGVSKAKAMDSWWAVLELGSCS